MEFINEMAQIPKCNGTTHEQLTHKCAMRDQALNYALPKLILITLTKVVPIPKYASDPNIQRSHPANIKAIPVTDAKMRPN